MNKKVVIILGVVVFILIIIFLVVRAASIGNKGKDSISPTSTQNISISPFPSGSISQSAEPSVTLKPDLNEELKDQAKADEEYGRIIEQNYTNYPWLEKLPLQNENYFIYFDTNEKKFFGQIYTQENQDQLKTQAINALKALGIQTEQYEIVWQ